MWIALGVVNFLCACVTQWLCTVYRDENVITYRGTKMEKLWGVLSFNSLVLFGCSVECTWHPLHSSTHISQSSFISLFQKSSKLTLSFIEKWPKYGRGLTSLFWEVMQGVWDTLKEKKRRKKETKAIRPCGKLKKIESHSAILCVSFRENKIQRKRVFQLEWCSSNEEIESVSVREWKRKRRHFSLFKLHTKKIK